MFESFGFSGNSNFFKEAGEKVSKGFFIISATLGTILLTIGSAYAGSFDFANEWKNAAGFFACILKISLNPISYLIYGAILLFIGAIGTFKDQERQNKKIASLENEKKILEDERKSLKYSVNSSQEELQNNRSRLLDLQNDLVKNWLKVMCKSLNLDTNSRVTIYYEYDEEFYLLARYSPNPTYSKVNRQKFPLNQGVISKAWQHRLHREDSCPDSGDLSAYNDYLMNVYSYEKEKIDSLKMKSCRYFAKAIVEADMNIGVIVCESTDYNFFQNQMYEKINQYCIDYQDQLAKFVRDSLNFDKEINIKRVGNSHPVEEEFLREMEEGK